MNWSYILFLSTQSEDEIIKDVMRNIEEYIKGDDQESLETILREGFEGWSIARNHRAGKLNGTNNKE